VDCETEAASHGSRILQRTRRPPIRCTAVPLPIQDGKGSLAGGARAGRICRPHEIRPLGRWLTASVKALRAMPGAQMTRRPPIGGRLVNTIHFRKARLPSNIHPGACTRATAAPGAYSAHSPRLPVPGQQTALIPLGIGSMACLP